MTDMNGEAGLASKAAGIRRLAGVLAYDLGGLFLVLAADAGFKAWQQSSALSQGSTEISIERYDDLGEPLGPDVIPVSEEQIRASMRAAALWALLGVACLVLGVLAKGAPFRDLASPDAPRSKAPPPRGGGTP